MPAPLHVHPNGKGYGWRPALPTVTFPLFSASLEASALPAKVDLRPLCPPVYDQGALGCCTGNAWAGAVEFLLRKQHLPDFRPSRLFIYYNERVREHDVPDDAGASITDGAHVVNTLGCPHEDLWPYDVARFADKPPEDAFADGVKHRALQVQQVNQNMASMKEILAGGLPIVIGFTVYESFESPQVSETGMVPMPGNSEQQLGGHCVLVVGYDDAESRFIVRNSWGTDWGQKGYCLMPYAYLTNPRLASDFWMAHRTE